MRGEHKLFFLVVGGVQITIHIQYRAVPVQKGSSPNTTKLGYDKNIHK